MKQLFALLHGRYFAANKPAQLLKEHLQSKCSKRKQRSNIFQFLAVLFILLQSCFQSSATVYYTTSSAATLNGYNNPSVNWTTNTDGTTGLTTITISDDNDEFVLLAGASVNVTTTTFIKNLTVNGNATLVGNSTNILKVRFLITLSSGVLTLASGTVLQLGNSADNAAVNTNGIAGSPNSTTTCIDATDAKIIYRGGIMGDFSIKNHAFKNDVIKDLDMYAMNGPITLYLYTDLTITGTLTFTKGILATTFNPGTSTYTKITLTETATLVGGHYTDQWDKSYIRGNLTRNTNSTNPYFYPVFGGEAELYAPITITPTSNTATTFTVNYNSSLDGFPSGTLCNTNRLDAYSRVQVWDVTRTSGTAMATITLPYNSTINNRWSTAVTLDNTKAIVVGHEVGGCWKDETGTVLTGDATSGTVTSGILNSFSPFTLAFGPLAPLPLRLLSFTGTTQNTGNLLQWQTANEQNVKAFEIERSEDGNNFATIATKPATNSGSYNYVDNTNNKTAHIYYRLKMLDNNGSFTYSAVIALVQKQGTSITVYPNPATDYITVKGTNNKGQVLVIDAIGKVVAKQQCTMGNTIVSTKSLQKGIYIIKYVTEQDAKTVTITKQ
ncbi:MAG: T9SS type A sorting domain-containing protein [Ferruginibacter sp.]